jgi:hypothetical protein
MGAVLYDNRVPYRCEKPGCWITYFEKICTGKIELYIIDKGYEYVKNIER